MPGDDSPGADVGLEATYRSQPSFQLGVVGFDPVVGVALDAMPRLGKNLFEHPEVARGLVGNYLDRRDDGGGHSTMKEPPGCAAVPPRGDIHVDHLAILVHSSVDVPPTAGDLDVSLIDLPSRPDRMPGTAGRLGQDRRESPDP